MRIASAFLISCVVCPLVAHAEEAPPPAAQEETDKSAVDQHDTTDGLESTDSEYELSATDLQELGFSAPDAGQDAFTSPLEISGFMDAGFYAGLNQGSKQIFGKGSLYLGNLNVYLSKQITESVRFMAETRFLVLPNGSTGSMGERIVTDTQDYQDFNRPLRWGGIEVERAYAEWSVHSLLSIRFGIFLTPYGIWNVDHGSPTIIPILRPFVIGNGYFPERQTGAELFGNYELSGYEAAGYHLTLSNGAGPISDYRDLDKNKALGGRVFFETRRLGELRLGASTYYGRYTDATTGFGSPEQVVTQYDDLAFALDLLYKLESFHFQAEWLHRQRAYTEDGRMPVRDFSGLIAIPPDAKSWGAYALGGYRLPWLGIMPFCLFQITRGYDETAGALSLLQFGINARPVPTVVLKVEYHYGFDSIDVRYLLAQVALAF